MLSKNIISSTAKLIGNLFSLIFQIYDKVRQLLKKEVQKMKKFMAYTLLACSCLTQTEGRLYSGNQDPYYRRGNDRYEPEYSSGYRGVNRNRGREIDELYDTLSQRFNRLFQNGRGNRDRKRDNGDFKADSRFKNRLFGRGVHEKPVEIIPQVQERVNRFKDVSFEDNGDVVGRGFGEYLQGQLPVRESVRRSERRQSVKQTNQSRRKRENSPDENVGGGIFSNRYQRIAEQNNKGRRNSKSTNPSQQSYVEVNYREENPRSNRDDQKSLYYNY